MTELLPLNISPLPVKLRVEDYLLLDDAGAFDAYRKTELIGGDVYFMNAQHRPHARIKSRLHVLLAGALAQTNPGIEAVVEGSVAIPPTNAPEPDIVLTMEAEGDGLIPLASVRLIIEVSDATLAFDLEEKLCIYAAAGVPEYWVADVNAKVIHQMWHPRGDTYAERRATAFGNPIEAASIAGLVIETNPLR
ncbi:MAG: Uma2 family endonuclease [Sphingomonas sp.]|jgi:Uma2 family endonuclease|uniref:Uma2 family endonuclease n=1 Tax=Sphingomonas sp. TaxID=28214 RepID=UPI0035636DCC